MEKKLKKQEKKQKFGSKKNQLFKTVIDSQLKGFLITCDKNKERNTLKEAFNFLNSAVEQEYPNLKKKQEQQQEQQETEGQLTKKVELSITNQLEQELQQMRKENSKIFYNFDIGTKVSFQHQYQFYRKMLSLQKQIHYQVCPLKLANYAMKQVHENDQSIGKFCHKLIPIVKIVPAEQDNLEEALIELIDEYLPHNQECSWMAEFKSRFNNEFKKMDIINFLHQILNKNPHWKASVKQPDYTIYIEINLHLIFLTILPKYQEYKKYSLHPKSLDQEIVSKKNVIPQLEITVSETKNQEDDQKQIQNKNEQNQEQIQNKNEQNSEENSDIDLI